MNELNIHHIKYKWRRTESIYSDVLIRDDDWSLLHTMSSPIPQSFNTDRDDLTGGSQWRVWLDHRIREGSARSGTEARQTCERLLAEYQQAQMMQQ